MVITDKIFMRSEILQEILNETPESIDRYVDFYVEEILPVITFLIKNKIKYRVERLQDGNSNEFTFTIKKDSNTYDLALFDYDIEPLTSALLVVWNGNEHQPTISGTREYIFDELIKLLV